LRFGGGVGQAMSHCSTQRRRGAWRCGCRCRAGRFPHCDRLPWESPASLCAKPAWWRQRVCTRLDAGRGDGWGRRTAWPRGTSRSADRLRRRRERLWQTRRRPLWGRAAGRRLWWSVRARHRRKHLRSGAALEEAPPARGIPEAPEAAAKTRAKEAPKERLAAAPASGKPAGAPCPGARKAAPCCRCAPPRASAARRRRAIASAQEHGSDWWRIGCSTAHRRMVTGPASTPARAPRPPPDQTRRIRPPCRCDRCAFGTTRTR